MVLGVFHLTQNSGNFGWYGPFRFGPSEILGTSFERSTLTGPVLDRSDRNAPFHLTKLFVPSTVVFCLQEQ